MSIQIYFAGLICHSGNDPNQNGDQTIKTRSIIVPDYPNHKPYITIKGQITKQEITTPVVFDPAGGVLATDLAFARCVPRLAPLTEPEVKLLDSIGIEVKLPAGTFYVASYFKVGGVYTSTTITLSNKCVAHYILLKAAADKLTITVNSHSFPLKSGDFVFIENASADAITTLGDHWAKYSKLLNGSKKLAKYQKGLPKEDCFSTNEGDHLGELPQYSQDQKKEDKEELEAASSECSNSAWP